jgi:polyhydroxyalkanoate synthase
LLTCTSTPREDILEQLQTEAVAATRRRRRTKRPNGPAQGLGEPEATVRAAPARPAAERSTPGFHGLRALDRAFKANLARLTNGISPAGMAALYVDWLAHLALSPGKQLELVEKAARKSARLALYLGQTASGTEAPPCIEPLPQDRRFRNAAWQVWPYNFLYQSVPNGKLN